MDKKQKSMWKFGIKYLKEIHKKKLAFNLKTWGSTESLCVYDENYCGTTACAAGHFALLPQFQAEGLWLCKGVKNTKIHNFEELSRTKPGTEIGIRVDGDPNKNRYNMEALGHFFGIRDWEAEQCFAPYSYGKDDMTITALDVAERMESILRNNYS